MPDQTLLRVAGDYAFDHLVRTFVLLVAGDDLDSLLALVGGVGGEVRQQVEHDVRSQHRIDGVADLFDRRQGGFIFQSPRTPELDRHADRAVAELLALGGDRERVGNEEFGDVAFVVVVHLQCAVEPTLARADGGLRFDQDDRDAVDEHHQIGPLRDGAGLEGVLLSDDVLVLLEVVEVDELDGDVLTVLAEGHRLLTGEPVGESLVGLHESVAADAHDDRPQLIDHVVGAFGVGGDRGVQPNEGFAEVILDECFLWLARKVVVGEVVPAESGELIIVASEAGADGGVVRDTGTNSTSPSKVLWSDFSNWLRDGGFRVDEWNRTRFGRSLTARGFDPIKNSSGLMCRVGITSRNGEFGRNIESTDSSDS